MKFGDGSAASNLRAFDEIGRGDVQTAGGKGANLAELSRAGFAVPPGFVLTTAAYRSFVELNGLQAVILDLAALPADPAPTVVEERAAEIRRQFRERAVPEVLRDAIVGAYQTLGTGPVAVRSSATAEDLDGASFAGQQDTYLNVSGATALLVAVRDCWASLWTARAMTYRLRQGIAPASVSQAVVVQQMVAADAAGVMFTANPGNGRRDELVISAAWGLGESVVGGSVTTDDLVVDRATRGVADRRTADKEVMTVYAEHGTHELPVPAGRRREPVLDDKSAVELAVLGWQIESHFGAPQDVEWARSDERFWIVQSRPITALPQPEAAPPTDWSVSEPTAFYVRASIVEQLPDPLTPLFADLIEFSVTRSLQALMGEFMGEDAIRDDDVALATVNGYAYYRYSRSGMIRVTLRTPRALPVLATTGERSGLTRWRERAHPHYVEIVRRWTARPLDAMTSEELFDGVVELLDAGTVYYTSVQTVIPIAAMSEVIFTSYYDRLIRRHGDPPAPTFLLGFDSAPILAEKALFDLASWTAERPPLTAWLEQSTAAQVVDQLAGVTDPPEVDAADWQQWRATFTDHLDRYGHAVYNLDFVNPVAADAPAPLVDAVRFYLRGGGISPYERQRRSATRREEETAAVVARLDPLRRRMFRRLLGWAQLAAPVREDALADIGLAWPQLRRMALELGRRLRAAGVVDEAIDVFWLRRDEITAALSDSGLPTAALPTAEVPAASSGTAEQTAEGPTGAGSLLGDAVRHRKMVWRGQRRVTPPQILPKGAWWEIMRAWMPAASEEQTSNVIKGTGASAGRVTAAAQVLTGPADFDRLRAGDVLVASITTPAWTSLFAMASGVVTDIGGPLSHSSIVAREYGIPAVLGTGVATRRIVSGQSITVDGDAGSVTLLGADESAAASPPAPTHQPRLPTLGVVAGAVLLVALLVRRRRRRAG